MKSDAQPPAAFDLAAIRRQFPALDQKVHGHPLVYLDSAATAQKPQCVLDALRGFYTEDCANVHRGVHELSQRATQKFEDARDSIARLVNAADPNEVVFTRGTTESINLVAYTLGVDRIGRDDEILLTEMEHHSNIVPWQILAERVGARVRVVPINDAGELLLDEYEKLLGPKTKIVALAHTSNALGTRNPVESMTTLAHERGIPVLLDGAQAVVHEKVDVQALDCDFFAFSGHKMYGPTGIGALYGKADVLESLPPFQGGGEMINQVSFSGTTFKGAPHRFEAGTPDIAGAIGFGAAAEFVMEMGAETMARVDEELLAYTNEKLGEIPDLRFIGTAPRKAGIVSFLIEHIHAHDLGTILDREGVAVRSGHHCAQPVMEHYGVPSTVRASFAVYNTRADVDALVAGIHKALELFA